MGQHIEIRGSKPCSAEGEVWSTLAQELHDLGISHKKRIFRLDVERSRGARGPYLSETGATEWIADRIAQGYRMVASPYYHTDDAVFIDLAAFADEPKPDAKDIMPSEKGDRYELKNVASLSAAVRFVIEAIDEPHRELIRELQRDELGSLHFSLGMWIRNRIIYAGCPLVDALEKSCPFLDPDGISGMIIEATWYELRDESLDETVFIAEHLANCPEAGAALGLGTKA